ncbi:carboxypeptidase regulatory-like domain-containing protein [Elizabethkingia meningoseptica]|uniref:carboxypeptidase regulatory-like domain-containing protein n=1 Tax=Elizabethkingia meningoseptica TaxID=238 RepID=UPI0009996FB8|nr:carboxypeptidase regulatory-like domain-containing protein [Elizabethkingia meningoseptica]MDE5436836.1 carboxypeptidase regulatory-like domain-containing protein [Elizabethkingia meningoseptica]MDE5509138.1 carboxypeptidase regulatory-like domain-containing protein [Elizabethkingia meningoseptica]MDE5514655.1 carboxypeptidase regulatory-like domain-containing protein [Elizabethkingia meningoseptica]MDE5525341.1 carboxypeptidase regulatory-like domain-containing protein [Elizabethkingia meni
MKGKAKIILITGILIICAVVIYWGLNGVFSRQKHYTNIPELSYYHGIVVDKANKAVQGAEVSSVNDPKTFTQTNKDGYFILKGNNIDVTKPDKIIVKKESMTDTVDTYAFADSGYKTTEKYYYSMKKKDTIILKTIVK